MSLFKAPKNMTASELRNIPISQVIGYNVETLKYRFLPAGYDIHQKDKYGRTLMHLYARAGRSTAIKYLLAAGASVKVKDNNGLTPLQYAIIRKDRKTIKLLTEAENNKGTRSNTTSRRKKTTSRRKKTTSRRKKTTSRRKKTTSRRKKTISRRKKTTSHRKKTTSHKKISHRKH